MMIKATAGQIVQNYNDGLDNGVVWEGETKEEIILDVLDGKIVSSDGDALVVDIPKIIPPKLMLTELSAMITFDEHGHMRLNTSDQRS